MIQMRRRRPAMEPITIPAMAPPVRVVVSSGSAVTGLLLLSLEVVMTVTVGGLESWRGERRERVFVVRVGRWVSANGRGAILAVVVVVVAVVIVVVAVVMRVMQWLRWRG
ncbi:hypothetical protein B0T21DRAFT_378927 [Apiosordaria backusii]|uniref:Uncharacterized protein n=1 Tax=Apiosordaria backusii TaxID=314023 RepID=A0AA40DHC8_9PEZI|nr:hypothetical protein B0T21DRAFT_378927 [Apiosordaria backusii]